MRKKNLFSIAIVALVLAVALPIVQAQTFQPLHNFVGGTDGAFPEGGVVRDAAGNLYGTTTSGGIGDGVVFKIDSTGVESVLFTFNAFVSGGFPTGDLIQDGAGNLYGVADEGPGGAGIVYKMSPVGRQTILHVFEGGLGRNARVPSGGLVMDKAGNLFGATVFGGNGSCDFGCGAIYRLDSAGNFKVLYAFTGGADGSKPIGALSLDAAGNLYGVAQSGGDLSCAEFSQVGCGTVFRIARNGSFRVLHTFKGGADGALPRPGLLIDSVAGVLSGTTASGGNADNGTVYTISSTGKYGILHRFNGRDGKSPNGGLVADSAGNLFGTAQLGGRDGLGTAFVVAPTGDAKVLHSFIGDLDGAFPFAGVIQDADGNLYGTAARNFLIQQIQGGSAYKITF